MQKNEDSDLLPLTTPFPKWMKETIPKWDKKLRITETGNAIFSPTKKSVGNHHRGTVWKSNSIVILRIGGGVILG